MKRPGNPRFALTPFPHRKTTSPVEYSLKKWPVVCGAGWETTARRPDSPHDVAGMVAVTVWAMPSLGSTHSATTPTAIAPANGAIYTRSRSGTSRRPLRVSAARRAEPSRGSSASDRNASKTAGGHGSLSGLRSLNAPCRHRGPIMRPRYARTPRVKHSGGRSTAGFRPQQDRETHHADSNTSGHQ